MRVLIAAVIQQLCKAIEEKGANRPQSSTTSIPWKVDASQIHEANEKPFACIEDVLEFYVNS